MNREQALLLFITKASALVELLECGCASGQDRSLFYGNGEVALRNVHSWLSSAQHGTLPGSYGKSGFGISKSDLMFGQAEEAMYDLESIYLNHLS
ncbi:MAG: hypothetical protein AABY68_11940 [Pseudomonadota bacterium]